MADKVYQVKPQPKGGYTVKEAAARCASGKCAEKTEAVALAKELAAKAGAAVQVLKADGSLEKEYAAAVAKPAAKTAAKPLKTAAAGAEAAAKPRGK